MFRSQVRELAQAKTPVLRAAKGSSDGQHRTGKSRTATSIKSPSSKNASKSGLRSGGRAGRVMESVNKPPLLNRTMSVQIREGELKLFQQNMASRKNSRRMREMHKTRSRLDKAKLNLGLSVVVLSSSGSSDSGSDSRGSYSSAASRYSRGSRSMSGSSSGSNSDGSADEAQRIGEHLKHSVRKVAFRRRSRVLDHKETLDERFVQGAAGIRALDWLTAGRLTKLQQHFKDRASKLHLHRKHSFADSSNSMSAPEFVSHCVDLVASDPAYHRSPRGAHGDQHLSTSRTFSGLAGGDEVSGGEEVGFTPVQAPDFDALAAGFTELFSLVDASGKGSVCWDQVANFVLDCQGLAPFPGRNSKGKRRGQYRKSAKTQRGGQSGERSEAALWKKKQEMQQASIPSFQIDILPEAKQVRSLRLDKLCFLPHNRRVVALESQSGGFKVLDAATHSVLLSRRAAPGRASVLAVEPVPVLGSHRDWVATSANDGGVKFWEPSKGWKPADCAFFVASPLHALSYRPREQTLIGGDQSGGLQFFQFEATDSLIHAKSLYTHKLVGSVRAHSDAILDLAELPGQTTVVSCGLDTQVLLWDVETLQQRGALKGHTKGVFQMAFHPQARCLATAAHEHAASVWDPYCNQRVHSLEHNAPLVSVSAVDGAPQLVTGDAEGVVKVWDVRTFCCVQTMRLGLDLKNSRAIEAASQAASHTRRKLRPVEMSACLALPAPYNSILCSYGSLYTYRAAHNANAASAAAVSEAAQADGEASAGAAGLEALATPSSSPSSSPSALSHALSPSVYPQACAYNPLECYFATGNGRSVTVWSALTGSPLGVLDASISTEQTPSSSYSLNTKSLAASASSPPVSPPSHLDGKAAGVEGGPGGPQRGRQWTRRLQQSTEGKGGAITCLAISPTGASLVLGTESGDIRVFGATSGLPVATWAYTPTKSALRRHRKSAALSQQQRAATLPGVVAVCVDAMSSRLIALDGEGTMRLLDTRQREGRDGRRLRLIRTASAPASPHGQAVGRFICSAASVISQVLAVGHGNGQISLVNPASLSSLAVIDHVANSPASCPTALCFLDPFPLLAVADSSGDIFVYPAPPFPSPKLSVPLVRFVNRAFVTEAPGKKPYMAGSDASAVLSLAFLPLLLPSQQVEQEGGEEESTSKHYFLYGGDSHGCVKAWDLTGLVGSLRLPPIETTQGGLGGDCPYLAHHLGRQDASSPSHAPPRHRHAGPHVEEHKEPTQKKNVSDSGQNSERLERKKQLESYKVRYWREFGRIAKAASDGSQYSSLLKPSDVALRLVWSAESPDALPPPSTDSPAPPDTEGSASDRVPGAIVQLDLLPQTGRRVALLTRSSSGDISLWSPSGRALGMIGQPTPQRPMEAVGMASHAARAMQTHPVDQLTPHGARDHVFNFAAKEETAPFQETIFALPSLDRPSHNLLGAWGWAFEPDIDRKGRELRLQAGRVMQGAAEKLEEREHGSSGRRLERRLTLPERVRDGQHRRMERHIFRELHGGSKHNHHHHHHQHHRHHSHSSHSTGSHSHAR